ncbi:hypothetical protein AB8E26_14965 [Stenotrophomonas rhizophila]|uniref:hypothetical protein n=1 Tax=Stenotrophomonas rhizophila TaxID=216778 RepID=UPI0035160A52
MQARKNTLIDIGAGALPSVTPPAPRRASWFPTIYVSPDTPPVEGVTPEPVADGVLIEWAAVDQAGVVYIIERGPTQQGPWTEIYRTTETRYLYSDGSGQTWFFRITASVRGKPGQGAVVEATPVPTTEQLIEQRLKLEKEIADRIAADANEAAARAQGVAKVTADLVTETQARVSAIAQAMDAISAESAARVDGLLNEKLAREAAITAEQQTRQSEVESLSRALSEVAAGSGTQFDSKRIWYFDQTVEDWSGNGVPTLVDGWLRPANAAANPYVQSPAALAIDGAVYRYVKLRIRKVGTPTWAGVLQWTTTVDGAWNTAKRLVMDEPAWDSDGVAIMDAADVAWWPATLAAIRLQPGTAQTVSNYYLIDWVAIGRPTPGASVALVQDETQARITALAAEASQRNTLAVQMRGNYTGNDLAGVTQGFVADERTARVAADSAQVSRITTMEARMPAGSGKVATEASVTSEAQARVSGDQANASDITAVKAQLDGKASAGALAALDTRVTQQGNTLSSQGSAITSVTAALQNIGGDNLLNNSSFEQRTSETAAPTGWTTAFSQALTGLVSSYVDSPLPGSAQAWRVTGIAAGGSVQIIGLAPRVGTKAVPGQRYTLSAFLRGTEANATALLIVWFYSSAGVALSTNVSQAFNLSATEWRRFTYTPTVVAPAGAAEVRVQLRLQTSTAGTYSFEADNAQLQQGEAATQWMPSISETAATVAANAAATSLLDGKVTLIGETVTAQGQALTSVTAQLQNIGGDNLLPNSSLEERTSDGAVPMRYVTSSSGTFTVSYVDSPLPGSTKALRMFRAGADGGAYLGIELQAVDRPKVIPGKKYVSTVYARGTAGQRMDGYIQFLTATGASNGTIQVQFAVTADFQRYVLVSPYAAPAGSVAARAIWRAHNSGTPGDLDLTIDNLQFQEGEVPTAWMPSGSELVAAGAANASATNALTSRVTAAEGSLTSLGQSVTSVSANLTMLMTGGVSIFPQGTMESFAVGQQAANNNGVTFTVRGGGANSGANIRRTGERALELNVVTTSNSGNADCNLTGDVPVSPSRTYYVEGYFRLTEASIVPTTGAVYLGVRSSDDAGGSLAWPVVYANHITLSKSAWTKVSGYVTTNANVARIRAFISMRGDRRAGTIIMLDDFSIMDVTDARAAQAAAEATATGLSSLTATVTQQGGLITAQGTRIDSVQAQVDGKASAQALLQLDAKVSASAAGGGNLLVNSTFASDIQGWEWANNSGWNAGRDLIGPDWSPVNGHTLTMRRAGVANVGDIGVIYPGKAIPADSGKRYMFSARMAGHRSRYALGMTFYDVNGAAIGGKNYVSAYTDSGVVGNNGGNQLSNYLLMMISAVAPAGTVTVRCGPWITGRGESDPYVWMTQPMLEQVPADKTSPSPWSAGGSESFATASLYTDVNGAIAGLQVKNDGSTSDFTIRTDVLRVLAPGGADGMEWQNGYIRVYRGNSQRIIGNGFGVPGEGLVDYFGPNVGAAAASKANATMWMDDGGNAYWGGSLAAGVLRNAVQTTTTTTVGASVTTGMFSTNGRNKAVTIGFSRRHSRIKTALGSQGFVAGAGANGATINVYRTLNGQGEVLWQQFGVGGSVEILNEFDGPDRATSTWGGAISINDPADGSTQRSYRAEVVGFTEQTVTHQSGSFDQQTITQSLSLVSIEQ